jgi:hypothetical protein
MVVNNLWELAPPEPPTADELREEAQRQAAKKVRRPRAPVPSVRAQGDSASDGQRLVVTGRCEPAC